MTTGLWMHLNIIGCVCATGKHKELKSFVLFVCDPKGYRALTGRVCHNPRGIKSRLAIWGGNWSTISNKKIQWNGAYVIPFLPSYHLLLGVELVDCILGLTSIGSY